MSIKASETPPLPVWGVTAEEAATAISALLNAANDRETKTEDVEFELNDVDVEYIIVNEHDHRTDKQAAGIDEGRGSKEAQAGKNDLSRGILLCPPMDHLGSI